MTYELACLVKTITPFRKKTVLVFTSFKSSPVLDFKELAIPGVLRELYAFVKKKLFAVINVAIRQVGTRQKHLPVSVLT